MAKIFISYRREDSQYPADMLFKALQPHVDDPDADIFIDVDSIPLGENFVKYLDQKVGECEILLALIGRGWLKSRNDMGELRLDNPEDFVRVEIASALKRGIPVVPILLDGAPIPLAADLPDDLKELAMRNGEEIRLNAERVLPLESARLNKAMGALRVRLAVGANAGDIATVVQHLAKLPDSERGDILVEMPLEDGRTVTLKLPSTYTISLKAQRALKEVPGVERVEALMAA